MRSGFESRHPDRKPTVFSDAGKSCYDFTSGFEKRKKFPAPRLLLVKKEGDLSVSLSGHNYQFTLFLHQKGFLVMVRIKVIPRTKRRTLAELQDLFYGQYFLSQRLFQCESSNELTDFEITDFGRFLDTVQTLGDLIEGLAELSPFADDALSVAESMTSDDFVTFKLALIHERKIVSGEEDLVSNMPKQFVILLLPAQFMEAFFIAEQFQVSLSVAMIRNLEV